VSGAVVVAPHPDDEVLGCAAVLAGSAVTVVHVTDGVPPWTPPDERDALERRRRAESEAAWSELSSRVDLVRLEFGDLVAWQSVRDIARALADLAEELEPDVVYLPAYQGGHPDHDATCLAGVLARDLAPPSLRAAWMVYGLYGFDDVGHLQFGWLPPSLYDAIEMRGAEPDALGVKASALRAHASQVWPDSALDQWLCGPVPERYAPLPARWDAPPDVSSYYDAVLGFGRFGASAPAVQRVLERALAPLG
jgi:N-acetylglucosamine malate deacetylase 2